ncbi:hypothetical protein [Cutibacterium sp. V947]|uniref:hypothetical protein n=2 Tax=Cutibacterium TaxID=1912216 RepID=UPI003F4F82E7
MWLKQDKASLLFSGALVLVGILLFFIPMFTWLSVSATDSSATMNGMGHISISSVEDQSSDDIQTLGLINSWLPAVTNPIHTMLIWTGIILIAAGVVTALTTSKLGDVIAAVSSGCMALIWLVLTANAMHALNKAFAGTPDQLRVNMGAGVIIGMVLLVAALAVSIIHLVRTPAPSRRISTDHL